MGFSRILVTITVSLFTVLSAYGQEGDRRLVWPTPPQKARVQYLYQIASPADIGVERSWLGSIFDWIIGAEDTQTGMRKPLGVAVDLSGRMYVTDPGSGSVHIFDREEEEYSELTEAGDKPLLSPIGVAVSEEGTLYITDSERREVIAFDDDGDEKFVVAYPFHRPTGIVIHLGKLYVVDTGLHKVIVFDLDGRFLYDFGRRGTGEGEFNYPVFAASSDEFLLVDAMNFRVQVLTDSGRFLRSFGKAGDAQGTFASPKGIALDRDGHIYVVDALFDAFQIFDRTGALLLVVGSSGRGQGEFLIPEGICIDKENRIYVVDSLNRRIQVFQYLDEPER